ncbi:CvpA family protein [Buchnera aphidicola]
MIAFFFLVKNVLNVFLKSIMRKMHLSHVNTILGGVCGIIKGIFFVMLLLWILQYFNKVGYDNYVKHSILITVFLKMFNQYDQM